MNKFIPVLLVVFILFSCSDSLSPAEQTIYRAIAYTSLDKQSRESIIINWKEASVTEGTYQTGNCANLFVSIPNPNDKMCFFMENKDLKLKLFQNLIAVSFNTNSDALLGPITVIIDPQSEKVTGFVGRL